MLDKIKQLIAEIESFVATTPEEVEQFQNLVNKLNDNLKQEDENNG